MTSGSYGDLGDPPFESPQMGPFTTIQGRGGAGFGTITNAAEECIDPHRDLPIAITVSLLI